MTKKHKPRSGSLAFYPRKRAKKETPSFSSFKEEKEAKAQNFLGYKAGMVHAIAKQSHPKSHKSGMDIQIPLTVIEAPPIIVFGIRLYEETPYGKKVLKEIFAQKLEKNLFRKIHSLKRKKKNHSIKELEDTFEKEDICDIKLLCHSQPYLTGIGKKKPEVFEISIGGNQKEKFEFAKQKLGNQINIKEVFNENDFLDIKAVTTGKGIQGPVKRFGVKTHRPKAKKQRVVGSIGPWNPATVMWQVARPGHMGYHSRTEFNKRLLRIGENEKNINPKEGFANYGTVKNDYILIVGSAPGATKRAIALRKAIRTFEEKKWKVLDLMIPKKESE